MPSRFAKTYLNRFHKHIKLQGSDGKEWIVLLLWKSWGRVDFGKGWNAFCRENNLQGGEVCVFELIKSDVLKVSLFGAVQDVKPEN